MSFVDESERDPAVPQFVLIGHPVSHSVSPAIHRAAYRALGRAGEYKLVDAASEAEVRKVVERIRKGELTGANVTIPWKKLALELADTAAPSARDVGVANTLTRGSAGELVAHNTDVAGLADELILAREELGSLGPERDTALVVGSGGAALAAVAASHAAGFGRVVVTARKFVPTQPRSEWPLSEHLGRLGAETLPFPSLAGQEWDALRPRLALVVQATSAGMKGVPGGEELASALELERLPRSVAFDLVYNPRQTPFLEAAARAGHVAWGGLGMLVGQAARAIEIWWGERPPRTPLYEAAERALGA